MRLKQAAPGEGDRGEYEHFTNWAVEAGKTHDAYTAGPCQWFVVHPSERTKPCLFWMTDKQLACKWCGKKPSCTVGYLPLWRATDWRPKFVIVYDAEREHIDPLPLHCRVKVGRENERGAAIYVRRLTNQEPPFSTTLARRRRPQDITSCLMMLWDIPELNMWCAARPKIASDNALSLDIERGEAREREREQVEQKGAAATPLPRGVADPNELFVAAVNRLPERVKRPEPSANGKHEKPRAE